MKDIDFVFQNRKAGSGPADQYSDSALLDSPEVKENKKILLCILFTPRAKLELLISICNTQSDGRRVKSTGDEAAPPQATQQRSRRPGEDEASVFFARPVKIRKNRGQMRLPLSNGSG